MNRSDRNPFTKERCNQIGPDTDGFTDSPGCRKFSLGFWT